MAAIAAVLAFSSTQLLAQTVPEATPPVTDAPIVTVPDVAPEAIPPSEPAVTSTTEQPAVEPAVEPPVSTTTPSRPTNVRRATTVTRPARAAPPVTRAPVAAPVAEPAQAISAPAAPVTTPAAPAPEIVAAPPPPAAPAASSNESNNLPLILGAVGIGLLGLIAFVVAMRRRKRRQEEELAEADYFEPAAEAPVENEPLFVEPAIAPRAVDPIAAAPFVAASAVSAEPEATGIPSPCADTEPGSHVEAACEGPTPDNPSLSITKRLKRARFFDQREFLVAAGEAPPMEADAGLPDALEVPESPANKPE